MLMQVANMGIIIELDIIYIISSSMGIISSYNSVLQTAVDNGNRSRIGTELVLVPKTMGTELDMLMYQS